MLLALTGTPGTGKSSVAAILQKKGFEVVDLNLVANSNNLFDGFDKTRKTKIIDIENLERYIIQHYPKSGLVILEGHVSHLLKTIDKVFILRCHPKKLYQRLSQRGWMYKKIKENVEAEILDVILLEAIERFDKENLFEIDTTDISLESTASIIVEIIDHDFKHIGKYKIGSFDWSEEIMKRF